MSHLAMMPVYIDDGNGLTQIGFVIKYCDGYRAGEFLSKDSADGSWCPGKNAFVFSDAVECAKAMKWA